MLAMILAFALGTLIGNLLGDVIKKWWKKRHDLPYVWECPHCTLDIKTSTSGTLLMMSENHLLTTHGIQPESYEV